MDHSVFVVTFQDLVGAVAVLTALLVLGAIAVYAKVSEWYRERQRQRRKNR